MISVICVVNDQSTKSPRTRLNTSSNFSAVTFETRALPTTSSLLPSQLYLLCHSSHSLHADCVKDDVLLDTEKSLRTNEAGLIDLAALTIALIQRDGERVPVPAAGDLT